MKTCSLSCLSALGLTGGVLLSIVTAAELLGPVPVFSTLTAVGVAAVLVLMAGAQYGAATRSARSAAPATPRPPARLSAWNPPGRRGRVVRA